MKFDVTTSGYFYSDIESMGRLSILGFKFKKHQQYGWEIVSPEEGIVVEINTLEDLMKFVSEHGEIILGEDFIEIYNDYRE